MLRGIGPVEIGLILLVVLIIFGVGKLPQVGASFGKSLREFRKATHGDYDEDKGINPKFQTQATEKLTKS